MDKKLIVSSAILFGAAGAQAESDAQLALVQVEGRKAILIGTSATYEALAKALEGRRVTPLTPDIGERASFVKVPPTVETMKVLEMLKKNLGESVDIRVVDVEGMVLATQDTDPITK